MKFLLITLYDNNTHNGGTFKQVHDLTVKSKEDYCKYHGYDLLVIDKSLQPQDGKIAICQIDGEFTVKRIKIEKNIIWLVAENEEYKPIKVTEENELMIWGIVLHSIKTF